MINFEQRSQEREKRISGWKKAAEDLREQLDQLKEREAAAMSAGDPDALAGIITERRGLSDKLEAYEKLIRACPPAWTDAEIIEAWKEAAADHNKLMEKKMPKYRKALREFLDVYFELGHLQHDTSRTYEALFSRMSEPARREKILNEHAKIKCVPVYSREWKALLEPVITAEELAGISGFKNSTSVSLDIRTF